MLADCNSSHSFLICFMLLVLKLYQHVQRKYACIVCICIVQPIIIPTRQKEKKSHGTPLVVFKGKLNCFKDSLYLLKIQHLLFKMEFPASLSGACPRRRS